MRKLKRTAVVLASVVMLALCLTSCSQPMTGVVNLRYDGSGEVYLVCGTLTEEEQAAFGEEIRSKIEAYNASENIERLWFEGFRETEEGTAAVVRFKHIARIYNLSKLYGTLNPVIEYMNFGKYYEVNKNDITTLRELESGESTAVEDFEGKNRYQVLYFSQLDVTPFSEVIIQLPSTVRFVSSSGIEVLDAKRIRLVPSTELHPSVDQAGNLIRDEEGNVVMEQKKILSKGYLLMDRQVNVWLIGGLSLIGAALLGGGIWLIVRTVRKNRGRFQSSLLRYLKKSWQRYVFLLPGAVLLILFCYVPMYGVVLAFKNYLAKDGIMGSEWVGLMNFRALFSYPYMGRMFFNTIGISLYKFLVSFPVTILFALLLNEIGSRWFKRTVQTVSYLPYFISWIVISGMAYSFLNTDYGLLNQLLIALGREPISWYTRADLWWTILMITALWKGLGWGTIIYLASIASINPELYEAACIDGAGRLKQTLYVTLPGMLPVIGINLVFSVSGLIRDDFEQIYALVGDNQILRETTEVFGTYIFARTMGGVSGYGPATALGLIQSVISLILVVGCNWLVSRKTNAGLW